MIPASQMKRIKYTKHARAMLLEREIPEKLIQKTIASPEKSQRGEKGILYAFKRVEDRTLRVVFREEPTEYVVVTVYFDRRVKL